jgi:hypothetical protein
MGVSIILISVAVQIDSEDKAIGLGGFNQTKEGSGGVCPIGCAGK